MKAKRTEQRAKPAEAVPRPKDADTPAVPLDLEESVAGEEDPGASLDLGIDPAAPKPGDAKPKP